MRILSAVLLLSLGLPAVAQENPFTKPGPAPKIVPNPTPPPAAGDRSVELFKPTFKLPLIQITVDDDTLKVLNKDPKKYVRCTMKVATRHTRMWPST